MNYIYITLQDLNDDLLTFMSKNITQCEKYTWPSEKIEHLKQRFIKANTNAIIAKIDLNTMKLLPIDKVLVEQPPVALTYYVNVDAPIESETIESATSEEKIESETINSDTIESATSEEKIESPKIESDTSEEIESATFEKIEEKIESAKIESDTSEEVESATFEEIEEKIESTTFEEIEEKIESPKIESPKIESDTSESEGIFHKMKIILYGKGVALIPSYNQKDSCKKYTDDGCGNTGWWNKNCNGWFFKKQFLKNLIINGAELDESITAFQLSAIFKEDESSVETVD